MKPIRVALSGSGFKFPAHVGALLAIRDAGFAPVEYAGTSGGSIIAMLAASGMSLDDMKELTLTNDWSGMLSWNPFSILNGSYCNGNALLAWLRVKTGGKQFCELETDLTIIATDVATEQPYIFAKDCTPYVEIATAARASASIPIVYAPVSEDGALLMDGGLEDNIPADKLVIDAVPRIGIQLVSKTTPFPPGSHSVFEIVPRLLDLMLTANENAHVSVAIQSGAHFAFVETGYAGGLDRNMSPEIRTRLLQDGYKATQQALAAQ